MSCPPGVLNFHEEGESEDVELMEGEEGDTWTRLGVLGDIREGKVCEASLFDTSWP